MAKVCYQNRFSGLLVHWERNR